MRGGWRFMRYRFGILFLLAAVLCVSTRAAAQPTCGGPVPCSNGGAPNVSQLNFESKRMLADYFGLTPDDPNLQRILDNKLGWGHDWSKKRPVIVYVRGQAGVPFPPKAQLMEAFRVTPEMREKLRGMIMGDIEAYKREFTTPPQLARCAESKTLRRDIGQEEGADKPAARFDLLFLAPEDMPPEPAAAFGKQTMVRVLKPEQIDGVAIAAKGYGIKCLPARIRVTNEALFMHEGADALKNYDEDVQGAGSLHPFVKERWEQEAKRAKGE